MIDDFDGIIDLAKHALLFIFFMFVGTIGICLGLAIGIPLLKLGVKIAQGI